jgi:hypothetical protein
VTSVSATLSRRSVKVLALIASGHTYDQILRTYPELSYADIFESAREALDLAREPAGHNGHVSTGPPRMRPRVHHPWSAETDARLTMLVRAGQTIAQIVDLIARSPVDVYNRMRKLGLAGEDDDLAEQVRGEQVKWNQPLVDVLDSLYNVSNEEAEEQRETGEYLMRALDESRAAGSKLSSEQ